MMMPDDLLIPDAQNCTAEEFHQFMVNVWADRCTSQPDGSILIESSSLYNEWYNAAKSAKRLGGIQTGNVLLTEQNGIPSQWARVWRFPGDKDGTYVAILGPKGRGCIVLKGRYKINPRR